jgi:alpha-amylase
MSTKGGEDGEVHDYFRPYDTPYDAYVFFMNALSDLQVRARQRREDLKEQKRAKAKRLGEVTQKKIASSKPARRD